MRDEFFVYKKIIKIKIKRYQNFQKKEFVMVLADYIFNELTNISPNNKGKKILIFTLILLGHLYHNSKKIEDWKL